MCLLSSVPGQAVTKPFGDHFADVANCYADFRPRYPAALFDWLADRAPDLSLAWDCAAGTGQASVPLADRFTQVVATDASRAQIASAVPHPRIHYRVAPAQRSGLDDRTVDLVTVAQALHWLDLDAFHAEVRRVVKPGGLLAVWTYGMHSTSDKSIDALVRYFYSHIVGAYWPPERRHVETGYRDLPFPFADIAAPAFAMTAHWSLPQLLGYLRSWSATARYVRERGVDPVLELGAQLATLWGDTDAALTITWPLALRAGRVAP